MASGNKLNRNWLYFAMALLFTGIPYVIYSVNMVNWRNSPDFGWRTMYDSGPNFVAEVFKRGESAGLKVGDVVQTINGRAYTTFDELHFEIRHTEPGSINTYEVERDGQGLEISIITGRLGIQTVMKRSGIIFLIGLVYVVIGVIVFLMKPHAAESLLFLVMTCLLGMEITFGAPSDLLRPLWFYDIRLLENCLLPAAMIHLSLRFPKTRSFLVKKPGLWIVGYVISITLFVMIKISSTAYWNVPPILDLINYFYLLTGVVVFLVSMIWNLFKADSYLIRLQSKMIFIGMLLGILIPVSDLIVRVLWDVYLFYNPSVGFAIFLVLFPLSIGYTIVKYDLFDIDTIIKRTYGYIITTGTIAGFYGLLVLVSNVAFGRFEITKSPLFPLVFVLAVIFLFNPVRNRMQKFINRVFYRLEYDYRETVQKISESMRTLLGLNEIGKSIMDTALGVMFIDSGRVMLLDKQKKVYGCLTKAGMREKKKGSMDGDAAETGTGVPEQEAEAVVCSDPSEVELSANDPFIQKIAERKREVTIYDIQEDPFFEADRVSCEKTLDQMEATLIVPLIYEDDLIGLISLGEKKSGKFYRREDINLLNTLANQGAVAVQNAQMVEEVIEKERMEEELNIARDLQVSMLPAETPQVEGFEIAAYSMSAREVGGDFYDFINMGEDKAGMVIGDVTGKSVSGALVMSASRTLFRTLSEEDLSVKDSMMRANQRLKKDVKSGMFVALLYAVIDSQDKILTLCSAGQTQPVHVTAGTGAATLVETKGDTFPLGILEDAAYEETQLKLETGDKVIFYTDGIVEAMNEEEEMFGFDRLLEVVRKSQTKTAEALLEEIKSSVNEFADGATQHDDITVIVLSVNRA